jgi:hypothetical protein
MDPIKVLMDRTRELERVLGPYRFRSFKSVPDQVAAGISGLANIVEETVASNFIFGGR